MADSFDSESEAFKTWFLSRPGAHINPSIAITDLRASERGRGVGMFALFRDATGKLCLPCLTDKAVMVSSCHG